MDSDKRNQYLFFGAVLLIGVVFVVSVMLLNPSVVYPAKIALDLVLGLLLGVANFLIFVVLWVIMLLGAWFAGFFIRWAINKGDANITYDMQIPTWGHTLISYHFGRRCRRLLADLDPLVG
jgi:hypothetical protein